MEGFVRGEEKRIFSKFKVVAIRSGKWIKKRLKNSEGGIYSEGS